MQINASFSGFFQLFLRVAPAPIKTLITLLLWQLTVRVETTRSFSSISRDVSKLNPKPNPREDDLASEMDTEVGGLLRAVRGFSPVRVIILRYLERRIATGAQSALELLIICSGDHSALDFPAAISVALRSALVIVTMHASALSPTSNSSRVSLREASNCEIQTTSRSIVSSVFFG